MSSSLNGPTAGVPTRKGGLIGAVYTRLTGKPYITVGGHASRDFGPTPGAEIAAVFDLSTLPDAVVMANAHQLLDEARRITRDLAAIRTELQR